MKKVELIKKTIDQLMKQEQLQSKTCHLLDESFVAVDAVDDDDDDDDDEAHHRHQLLSQLSTQVFLFIFHKGRSHHHIRIGDSAKNWKPWSNSYKVASI